MKSPSFFISGVIQGSSQGRELCDQSYRERLAQLLKEVFPHAEVVNPYDLHPNSIDYSLEKGKATFLKMVSRAAQCDVLIAYLPEASLGTAIEMWECSRVGIPIWTISPMKENWVIKFFSQHIFSTLEEFQKFLFAEAREEVLRAFSGSDQRSEELPGRSGAALDP